MIRRVSFAGLSRAALDAQLSPSRSAKDPWGVLARHEAETAAAMGAPGMVAVRDLAHGPAPRARLDILRPAGPGAFPCLAHVHGGFWQEGGKAGSGFAARVLAARGWAMAAIGYTLAPEAGLPAIIAEIAGALAFLAREGPAHGIDARRIVISGHSAGAHLAAAMLAGLGGAQAAALPCGAVLVSGVYDLAPVAASYVNDLVGITPAQTDALSPLLFPPRHQVPVHLLVGADEPEAFLLQTEALARAWGPLLPGLTVHRAPGRDHFDVLDELADPGSPSFRALMAMAPAGARPD
ncbi:MAG: esterase [Paracoccaceae bacterium]|nr:MAG: esterase [Paracoccaceae bacterium]